MSKTKKADTAEEKKASKPESEPETSATTGWASGALDRARSEEEKKAQKKAALAESLKKKSEAGESQSSQPAPEAKELSAAERLRALTAGAKNVPALIRTLADAKNLEADQELVDDFLAQVKGVEALAEYKLSVQAQSDIDWSQMTWRQREEQLRQWAAEGDDQAQALVAELDKFLTFNPAYKVFLYDVVEWFYVPLTSIASQSGFQRFMDELVEAGWVKFWRNPHWPEPDGVEISWGPKERFVYVPMKTKERKEKSHIARAWPYIKMRLAKVKEIQEGLDELRSQATPGFTPAKISHGEEGFLFIQTGATSAVLLEAISEGSHGMLVKVVGSVGCDESRLPSDCQLWDNKTHRPMNGNTGKWAFITRSLEYHGQRRESFARERKELRDKQISPLTKQATFGTRFEEQGLTRLIQGEQGCVAFWNARFRWKQREKFFGLAIRHTDDGTFVLEAVVSDFPFPQELIGQKLPLAVNAEKLQVELESGLPWMKPEVHDALKMVRVAINSRLEREKRASAESSDEETESETE